MTALDKKHSGLTAPLLAGAATILEIALFPLLLPGLKAEFDVPDLHLSLVVTAHAMAVAVGVLASALLGDRLGTGNVFRAGAAGFVVGSLGSGLSPGIDAMILFRVLQGVGGGLMAPAIPVLLARASAGRPGRLLSLWYSLSGFLIGAAPLLLSLIGAPLDRKVVLTGIALLALPALLGTAEAFPKSEGAKRNPITLGQDILKGRDRLPYLYVALTYGTVVLLLFRLPLQGSAGTAALLLSIFWTSFATCGLLARNIIDGPLIGRLLFLSPIPLCIPAALILYAPGSTLAAAAYSLFAGAGFAICNASATTLLLRNAPQDGMTLAAGLDIAAARTGSAMLVTLLGGLSENLAAAGLAAVLMLSLWCAYPLRKEGRARTMETTLS